MARRLSDEQSDRLAALEEQVRQSVQLTRETLELLELLQAEAGRRGGEAPRARPPAIADA